MAKKLFPIATVVLILIGAAVFTSASMRPVPSANASSTSASQRSAELTLTSTTSVQSSSTTSASSVGTYSGSPAKNFSIFWITDTQFLSETNPGLFKSTTQWIAENWAKYGGRVVVHTGDIVQTGSNRTQWENANAAMSVLLNAGIPYTWDAGNHDDFVPGISDSGWNGSLWAPAFNPAVVAPMVNAQPGTTWVGDYHDGMDTAVGFTASGLNFLVVNIEWNGDPATVLKWVSGILDDPAYADYHVIIATHAYIDETGSLDTVRWGGTLASFVGSLTTIMGTHIGQVFLTLNGHFGSAYGYHTPSPVHGRNELVFNRQDCLDNPDCQPVNPAPSDKLKVGAATVTILTFDTSRDRVYVSAYDVYARQFITDPTFDYSFTMFPAQAPPGTPTEAATGIALGEPQTIQTAGLTYVSRIRIG